MYARPAIPQPLRQVLLPDTTEQIRNIAKPVMGRAILALQTLASIKQRAKHAMVFFCSYIVGRDLSVHFYCAKQTQAVHLVNENSIEQLVVDHFFWVTLMHHLSPRYFLYISFF